MNYIHKNKNNNTNKKTLVSPQAGGYNLNKKKRKHEKENSSKKYTSFDHHSVIFHWIYTVKEDGNDPNKKMKHAFNMIDYENIQWENGLIKGQRILGPVPANEKKRQNEREQSVNECHFSEFKRYWMWKQIETMKWE